MCVVGLRFDIDTALIDIPTYALLLDTLQQHQVVDGLCAVRAHLGAVVLVLARTVLQ